MMLETYIKKKIHNGDMNLNENIIRIKQVMGIISEEITSTEVICDKCEWTWKLSDGGSDPYICHKCGHDNQTKKSEMTERCWKGYTQKGMKTMFGKRYPNCVKKK